MADRDRRGVVLVLWALSASVVWWAVWSVGWLSVMWCVCRIANDGSRNFALVLL